MEHNDITDKDLPADPDATEIVAVDLEAMLHMELDAKQASEKASKARIPTPRPAAGRPPKESIATIRAMRAAPRTAPLSSRFPSSRSAMPRPPIHTLLPPCRIDDDDDDEDEAATCVFDRAREADRNGPSAHLKARSSVRSSVPSVRSVAFPAPTFSAPRISQPFHTVPAIPAAKRAPDALESQQTPVQPVLPPTSRRDIRIPSVFESLAPMAMSAFPSMPPAGVSRLTKSSMFAIVLTLIFTLASVALMGVGIFRPNAIERGKVALGHAMKGKQKHVEPVPAAKPAEPVVSAQPIAVPPVLIDNVPADLGEKETALFLPDAAKGHRVFVDGRVLNETEKPYVIATCGKHKVQVGSTGKEQVLELPCGGVSHAE